MKHVLFQITALCVATYTGVFGLALLLIGNARIDRVVPDVYFEDELAYRTIMQAHEMQQWGITLLFITGLIVVAMGVSMCVEAALAARRRRAAESAPSIGFQSVERSWLA